jgi:DNA-binding Xre family transcriptional regulator
MTSSTSNKPRRLKWRTRVVMAERGVRSVAALRRQLEDLGITISDAQLGRIVDGKSSHFNATVIGGLLTALNCGLSDLIAIR